MNLHRTEPKPPAKVDLHPHASTIMALMKAEAETHPTRRYAKNWASTCIVVDAYRHFGGCVGHWRFVWRINGRCVKRVEVEAELLELVGLGLASVNDISLTV